MAWSNAAFLDYFTKKKTIFVILIFGLVLGGAFYIAEKTKKKELKTANYEKRMSGYEDKKYASFTEKDSDNDGLKDWEETLWKTNPKNPDTNGNGIPDGEEILKIKQSQPDKTEGNLSEGPAKTFLSELPFLEKSQLSKEGQEKLIQSFTESLDKENPAREYGATDIKISQKNSKEEIKKYINSAGLIMKDFSKINKTELELLQEIINEKNPLSAYEKQKRLDELESYAALYKKAIEKLLIITVPSNYKDIHLGFINNFSKTAEADKAMSYMTKDPIKAVVGLRWYTDEVKRARTIFEDLKTKIAGDKIEIGPEEDGYEITKYLK